MKNQDFRRLRASTKFLKMFTSMIVLLGICLHTEAKKFDEAECRPRPTVVAVSNDYKMKPYHIELYRCSGTFESTSPVLKTCAALEEHEVWVDVVDEHGKEQKKALKNHTKCGSVCATKCREDEFIDKECKCTCIYGDCPEPNVSTPKAGGARQGEKTTLPLSYIIGMGLVGLFAVFVLVFDAMLCAKKKGFMYTVKHSCCGKGRDRNMNDNQPSEHLSMVPNGKASKHTDV